MGIFQAANGRWRLQLRRKHLRVDEYFDTEEEAKAAELEALEALAPSSDKLTLSRLWERYSQSQQFEDKAVNTQTTERTRIRPVLAKLGNYTLAELEDNPGAIYDYMDARRKVVSARTNKRISNASIRLEIAALSALVEFAKKRRMVRENFVSHISRPAQNKRKRRVAPVEQGRLKLFTRNSNPDIAKAARFLLLVRHLGCRPGELMALAVRDVLLDTSEVIFRDTKNGTDRRVHATAEARELLALQLEDLPSKCEYMFFTWSRFEQAFVPYNYAHGVRILRELEVISKDMHAHAGRREFVSRAIESGVELLTIKKQTGHKSVQALEIYDEGLATAPEVRQQLDALAAKVADENLWGAMEAAGMTLEQRQTLLDKLGHSEWKTPPGWDKPIK